MEKLTAQDVRNVTFEKGMRGYRTEDVDAFLTQVADQLEILETEKKEAEEKIRYLAQKVSDYRKDEDNLKAALLNAQRMGDNIIQEATSRATQIVREAQTQAQAMEGQASLQIEQQKNDLARLQEEIGRFKSSILALYRQHIESLSTLPEPAVHREEIREEQELPKQQTETEQQTAQEEVPDMAFELKPENRADSLFE